MAENVSLAYIDFLDSEIISLQASKSRRIFKVHRELLASKCKIIVSAFERGFEEGQKGSYTFKGTSEGTLARFIEWLYTGVYPGLIEATEPRNEKPAKVEETQSEDGEAQIVTAERNDLASENHPLLAHIRLYIFSSIYIIPDLQILAFGKITACLTDLERPKELETQLAVIAALRLSFRNLPVDDQLLDWLGHYAAYSVQQLRLQTAFLDLMQESPKLYSRIILSLEPASQPPWRTPSPKYIFPRYTPGDSSRDRFRLSRE